MKIIELTNVDFSLRHFLLPLMRALRARGHEVVGVCAEGPLLDDVRAEGFRIIPAPFARRVSPFAHIRAFFALVDLFRAEAPDLVHAHMPISGFLARLAARWAGVPRVAFTCHGFLFNHAEGGWPQRALSLGMEFAGGKATDIFLTVSTEEAGDARRLHIARNPVAVANGRDPAVFRPDPVARSRLRGALGTPPDRVVVLAVSRLVARKGYRELAAAMREVPNAELWVAGDRLESDRGEDMVAMLRSAGLGDRLHLLGYRSDVAAVMAAADVFALPSYFEGLPMSVIEAMLTGLPVVATSIRGPREQVVPDVTGLLVKPRDSAGLAVALRRLAADKALRAAMGEAGRARALELYDEAKVLARTIAALGA
ncbi:MAG TPA: glycosyltransferase family 4 protein [Acetobacteraceae bacterium]|nr:glycosyltransferase family 4 protein [Acetobacteraceae bacterium]